MGKSSNVVFGCLLTILICSMAVAADLSPPPGWGQPASLPSANGKGQVSFKQGGKEITLPLNNIEIDDKISDIFIVSLAYVDARQENKLELTFSSMPKLGKNDLPQITGFVVSTKDLGISKSSAGKSQCDITILNLTTQEASGTLSCKGMTDLSAEKAMPDVTEVKFEGKVSRQ